MTTEKKDAIRAIIIQLANFIDGGSEQVDATKSDPLMYFDTQEKAVIERAVDKVAEVADR